jgi:hypothetical protein
VNYADHDRAGNDRQHNISVREIAAGCESRKSEEGEAGEQKHECSSPKDVSTPATGRRLLCHIYSSDAGHGNWGKYKPQSKTIPPTRPPNTAPVPDDSRASPPPSQTITPATRPLTAAKVGTIEILTGSGRSANDRSSGKGGPT